MKEQSKWNKMLTLVNLGNLLQVSNYFKINKQINKKKGGSCIAILANIELKASFLSFQKKKRNTHERQPEGSKYSCVHGSTALVKQEFTMNRAGCPILSQCYIIGEAIMQSFQNFPFQVFRQLSPRCSSWLWPSCGSSRLSDQWWGHGQKSSNGVPKVEQQT